MAKRKSAAAAAAVEVEREAAPDLIGEALAATKPKPSREAELKAAGYKIIVPPAGSVVTVRVNKYWIAGYDQKPWLVAVHEDGVDPKEDAAEQYADVVWLGEVRARCVEVAVGCRLGRGARVVSQGPVAVKA